MKSLPIDSNLFDRNSANRSYIAGAILAATIAVRRALNPSHWSRTFLVASLSVAAATAQAAAPQLKTQVAGWQRTMVGDFEVTALYDGYNDLDPKLMLKNTRPGEIERGMNRAFQSGPTIQLSMNGFLINTGTQLILVDTGARGLFPTGGHLKENLKAAGYTPEQIDLVLLTHLHVDHIGGLIDADGQLAFPNAQVLAPAQDAAFWLDDATKAKFPKEMHVFFDMTKAAVTPLQAAGRWKTFESNADVASGVKAVTTSGHSIGHTSYMFESNGQKLLAMGDMIHVGSVQFAHPEVGFAYDTDSKQAIATRKKWFAQAAKVRLLLGGAHLPFPGVGHVRSEGKGYAWVPIEYMPIRTDLKQ
jgi:glyoxylase-like metal-dependent hydrolase (beta-lactamase superfamily II)